MKQFRFVFEGELRAGFSASQVAAALGKAFGVSADELMPLLRGQDRFERDQLDGFTAKAYQEIFYRAGARGQIIECAERSTALSEDEAPVRNPTVPNPTVPNTNAPDPGPPKANSCPKCGSTNRDVAQCFACGIFIEKYVSRIQAASEESPATDSPWLDEPDPDGARALGWLRVASTVLLVLFIADAYLQDAMMIPNQVGIDIGYLPFLFAHLILLRGCVLHARHKGYSGWAGLLAFASLAGLALLVLLPDRQRPHHRPTTKQLAVTLVCVLVSVYWAQGFFGTEKAAAELAESAGILKHGRSEYPLAQLDSDERRYQEEQEEIYEFLSQGLTMLAGSKFRPNEVSKTADILFGELARYQAWRNYQSYLHLEQGRPLPEALRAEQSRENYRRFIELLRAHITEESPPRLIQAHTDWFVGYNPEIAARIWFDLSQHLNRVTQAYMHEFRQRSARAEMEGRSEPPDIDLATLPLDRFNTVQVHAQGKLLSYSAPAGPLAENPLVLAFYLKPYQPIGGWPNKGDRTDYLPVRTVISPGFPNKFLYGDYNLLKDYIFEF